MRTYTEAQIRACYVVGYGSDCDGYSSFRCSIFHTTNEAVEYANEQNEWSDGISYTVVGVLEAIEYCDCFCSELPNFYD